MPLCPPSCLDLKASSCTGQCVEGERLEQWEGVVPTQATVLRPQVPLILPQDAAVPRGSFSMTLTACRSPNAPALWVKS